MKTRLNAWIAATAFSAILLTACSKTEQQPAPGTDSHIESSSSEITVLTDVADNEFMNMEVSDGNETEGFMVENDGLPDAYQVSESTADEVGKRDDRAKRFKACLVKLQLSQEQIAKMRRIFKAYEDCKGSIIARHALAVKELLAKFNARHEELLKALKSGRINKQQFEEKMKAMRIEFNRTTAAFAEKARAALKDCYMHMLRGMHGVLTDRQWKAFVNCYR